MVGLIGVTVREDRLADVTVRVVPPETSSKVAVMIVVPAARPLAKPLLSTVATAVSEDRQVTNVVISSVGATGNFPVAVSRCVVSTSMIGFSGVTVMEVGCPIGLPPPHVVKDTAKEPRNNIARKNLKSFISHRGGRNQSPLGTTRSGMFYPHSNEEGNSFPRSYRLILKSNPIYLANNFWRIRGKVYENYFISSVFPSQKMFRYAFYILNWGE